MDRRVFMKYCTAATSGSILANAGSAVAGVMLSNQTLHVCVGKHRPNVIYIMADDLGYGDLGCYGQTKIRTPYVDKMAAEGMRFMQHYAGSTVCAPARCSLMTGLHTGRCYIRGNATLPLRPEDLTVAEVFKQAGYHTGCIGKWGLGNINTTGHPNNKGFDYFYGHLDQLSAHFYYPDASRPIWENQEDASLDGQTYSHDIFTEKALNYIRQNKDQPFFLYMAYTIPHAELVVPEEPDLVEYRKLDWPETPWPGNHYGAQVTPRAAYAAMVTRLDRDTGRILKLLKTLGLDDNTLVIFTSDNGPHAEGGNDWAFFNSNGPFRGIKRTLYEGGIRVPFIARWPGTINPGTVSEHISAFWDFLPTCCELAGQPVPEDIDGISYLPELLGRSQRTHDYLYWEFFEHNGRQAIRQDNWKMVRLNVNSYTTKEGYLADVNPSNIKLYDLSTNIGESDTQNLVSSHPDKAEELKSLMDQAHVYSPHFRFRWE